MEDRATYMRSLRAEQQQLWRRAWNLVDRIDKGSRHGHRKSSSGTLKRIIAVLEPIAGIAENRASSAGLVSN